MAVFEEVGGGSSRAGKRPPFGRENVVDARFVEGQTQARTKLLAWFQKLVAAEAQGELVCHLYQIGSDGEHELGDSFTYDVDEGRLEKFVDDVIEAAVDDMQDTDFKRARYAVRVEGFAKRQGFDLKAPKSIDTGEDEDSDPDELPNERGVVAQLMRLFERTNNQLIGMVRESRLDRAESRQDRLLLVDHIRQLQATKEAHERKQVRQMIITEELLNAQAARDIKIKEATRAMDRKDQVVAAVVGVGIPLIANAAGVPPQLLAGLMKGPGRGPRPPPPNGAPPGGGDPAGAGAGAHPEAEQVAAELAGLVDEIEAHPGLIEKLGEILTPKMQHHLYNLHTSVQRRREGAQARGAPPGGNSGSTGGPKGA
jgi:hypothetical protein